MLVLSRKRDEKIHIGNDITITVVDVRSNGAVRLGIDAPGDVEVHRAEVFAAIHADREWRQFGDETAAAGTEAPDAA